MNDARADFEGNTASSVAYEDTALGSPVPVEPPVEGYGYVVHEDLAAWIAAELTPKLQALVERLTALEAEMRDLRQQVAERYDNTSQAQGEWAETFNRAQAQHDAIHKAIGQRLEVLEAGPNQTPMQPAESGA